MKPRACETAVVRSLHPDLAPVGEEKHMTPQEADLMVRIGRAEWCTQEQAPYPNRAMTSVQPQRQFQQKPKHKNRG